MKQTSNCALVGEKQIDRLMMRYLGLAPENINDDEKEILLFALYMESLSRGGIAARPTAAGDARVAEAKAKLDAIIAEEEKTRREAARDMKADMYGDNGNG